MNAKIRKSCFTFFLAVALCGCGGGSGGGNQESSSVPTSANSGADVAPVSLSGSQLALNGGSQGSRLIQFQSASVWTEQTSSGQYSATYEYVKTGAGQNARLVLNEKEGQVELLLTFNSSDVGSFVYLVGRQGSGAFTLSQIPARPSPPAAIISPGVVGQGSITISRHPGNQPPYPGPIEIDQTVPPEFGTCAPGFFGFNFF